MHASHNRRAAPTFSVTDPWSWPSALIASPGEVVHPARPAHFGDSSGNSQSLLPLIILPLVISFLLFRNWFYRSLTLYIRFIMAITINLFHNPLSLRPLPLMMLLSLHPSKCIISAFTLDYGSKWLTFLLGTTY